MMLPPDFDALTRRFDDPGTRALVLMGSYARGDPGPFSDVDLRRFVDEEAEIQHQHESYLIGGRLVVVSNLRPAQVEAWFSRPEEAVNVIAGLRDARALIDRDDTFATIQSRARTFEWDTRMQEQANKWAGQEMVGWIEEVHKGLQGLHSGDVGRMLHARFGLSWGLSWVTCVGLGVLLSGGNTLHEEVMEAVGANSEWARLSRTAFGIEDDAGRAPPLREQVVAGLHLYTVTAGLLAGRFQPANAPLIEQTVELIRATLSEAL